MKVFKSKAFSRSCAEMVTDEELCEAVGRAERGLIDASLGKCLIKQRIAREGGGRSGGFRTVIFYREGQRAIFLYIFPKNGKSNLTKKELEAYRSSTKELDALSAGDLKALVETKGWSEIDYESIEEDIRK